MKYLLIVIILISFFEINAQTKSPKEEAKEYAIEAIRLMDQEGKYKESIELLVKAQELDSENEVYPYEIAYAYYSMAEYEKAIKILKKLTKGNDVNDRVFQLLGNSYDFLKKPEKAVEIYLEGLKLFPKSGSLHLELGILELSRKNYDEAISYWEKGVKADPDFSSNYYWLGKIFSQTDERIWSVFYGELFMNLERNSKRTVEMSKILFETYKASISADSDTSGSVSFTKVIAVDPTKEFKIPFQLTFGLFMTMSSPLKEIKAEKSLSINSINLLRQNFIGNWFSNKKNEEYPNVLLDYLKEINDKGYLEPYNYWFLMKGNEDEFLSWYNINKEAFEAFTEWYTQNPISIDENNYFVRLKYN